MPVESPCFEHTGCKLPNGYGKVGMGGKTWLAHRLAWTMFVGPIPEGMHVCHRCDNRACVNVNHLFLGTRRDNMQDMIAKGRARFVGLTSANYRPPEPRRGDLNGRAKLTAEQVADIRQAGGERMVDTARRFGVSFSTVQRIKSGVGWSHLQK